MPTVIQNRSFPAIGNPTQSNLTISVTGGTLAPLLTSTNVISGFDAIFTQRLGAGIGREPYVITTNAAAATFRSFNTTVATVTSVGSVGTVIRTATNGQTTIRVTGNSLTKSVPVNMTGQVNQPITNTLISVVSGTLAEHLCTQVDSRIAGKNPTDVRFVSVTGGPGGSLCGFTDPNFWQRWPAQIPEPQTYTRNPGLWCSGIDVSFISPWNSDGGTNFSGSLITPRHFIRAAHWPYRNFAPGTRIHFVDMNNNIYVRTIIGEYDIFSDIKVCTLNADISAGCNPVKLFPNNVYSTRGGLSAIVFNTVITPPMVVTTQDKNFYIAESTRTDSGWASQPATNFSRAPFFYGIRGGDSGSPAFFIVNNQPSLTFTLRSAGGTSTYNPSWFSDVGDGGSTPGQAIDRINLEGIPGADTIAGLLSGYANSSIWPVSGGRYIAQLTDVSMFPVRTSVP
ncbi:hypothetical protein UFOVP760_111 [uncultured Caudovirales phage]|uniref:Uncharacterized protein n=1 Tax=uncultured Caudovirales phage TaxID=2100421 RepID=A0A6J7XEP5_9CAUD|nr:hypothetical protein UFOVP760_111 [uncultured Caudovirales phage]